MTWLAKPLLLRIFVGVAAAWLLTLPVGIPTAHAQNWGEIAVVSENLGVSDSRICIGDGTRGDIGCPGFAPTISPTGRINASAGLTVNTVSLTTTGTTWGFLGSGASYLPNLSSNAISATNISASTINGISVTALGGGASPTNVPAFRVHKNGSNQTLATSSIELLTWTTEEIDTYNNFNLANGRFTPTIAGYYFIQLSVRCGTTANLNACLAIIRKNGTNNSIVNIRSPGGDVTAIATALIYMNGTSDYVDAAALSEASSAVINGAVTHTNFSGFLLR